MSKDLFKQAIAEAKSVREAAIANAKEASDESFMPQDLPNHQYELVLETLYHRQTL